jgi:hypothetical protein
MNNELWRIWKEVVTAQSKTYQVSTLFQFFFFLICIVGGGGWNQGPLDTAAT